MAQGNSYPQTSQVRVRIAPSPTGDPHVGLAYVTLFNFAFARKHAGKLILRIEDTDRERARESSERLIMESLKWLGFSWDEGPDVGGPHGPYKQSERTGIYVRHAQELVAKGKAYPCFCTAARLDEMRAAQKAQGQTTGYDRRCLELAPKEAGARLQKGEAHVIRLKMPTTGKAAFHDELRGEIEFDFERFDDQVLIKSDGFPTYHLANIVDDHLMGITHVMRAEEWIASTPKHIVLYEAFGWQPPKFVHLPLLRNADRSKISKRKNPTSLNYYRRKGILPKAMLNFLALMGWSFSEAEEIFSLAEMIPRFDYKDIHLGGPVFDVQKLLWLNQKYIQKMEPQEFVSHLRDECFGEDYLLRLYPLVKERLNCFEEFTDRHGFFFGGALSYEGLAILPKNMDAKIFVAGMETVLEALDGLYVWTAAKIHDLLEAERQKLNWKPKDFFMPIRLMTTGRADSPPLPESLEAIGREMVRFRLKEALGKLASNSASS